MQKNIGSKNTESRIKSLKMPLWLILAREGTSILIWSYLILKIFFFDVDRVLFLALFPGQEFLLNFKFLLLLLIVSLAWLCKLRPSNSTLFYICFYPFIVILWRVPLFIWSQGSWLFVLMCANACFSLWASRKYIFISFTARILAVSLILFTDNAAALFISAAVLLSLLLTTYVRALFAAIRPSFMHRSFVKLMAITREKVPPIFTIDQDLKVLRANDLPIQNDDKKIQEEWVNSLQNSVLFNRACLFVAKQMREYQTSGADTLTNSLIASALMLQNICVFAFVNFALFKLDAAAFSYEKPPGIFLFFYYSFNGAFTNSIPELTAQSQEAQLLSMIAVIFTFLFGVIFVSFWVPQRARKAEKELDASISAIEKQGREVEVFIQSEYRFHSVEEAISELNRLEASLASFLRKLSSLI